MKPETKKIVTALGLISFTVVMLGIALNFGSVCRWITRLIDVFMPFIIGIVFALFLSVPMNFMERKVLAGKQFDKMRRTLAILITLVLVFGIIGAVGASVSSTHLQWASRFLAFHFHCTKRNLPYPIGAGTTL